MKKIYILVLMMFVAGSVWAQTNNYFGTTGTISGSVWNIVPAGPYTNALVTTGGAIINFGNAATPTGATVTVVGINATANTTWSAGGTLGTGGTVAPIDVAPGITLNLAGQSLSTAAGTGFSKSGAGTLFSSNGNAYAGGFTLNAGTMVVGGVNAMGGAAGNTLTLNGGILTANGSAKLLTNKYPNGITIGGDVQIGEVVAVNPLAGNGNFTFTNDVSLGAVSRILTLGNGGTHTFSGIISNTSGGLTFAANANGTGSFVISGVNTYSGGTIITGGTLACGLANTIPSTGTLTLGGGTLRTGTGAGFTQSTGTLNLTANSTLTLGTGVHSISFLNSSAESWNGAAALTITGWAGGYDGTASSTAGRIFVGSDATGLTVGQLAQIIFFDGAINHTAVILSTGEVVPAPSASIPDITLSSPTPAVPAGNIAQGSTSTTNNPIYEFNLAVATANANLKGVTINTTGTYTATDISRFKCWYSADNIFSPGTDVLLSTLSPVAAAGAQVFPAFISQVITNGSTGYIFITADLPCAATVANNISVNTITTGDISFASGNKTGTAFAGDVQTIIAATPNDARFPAATVANASSSVSWSNPLGCYDEVMIIATEGVPNNGGIPTGDGTAYTANPVYANGTTYGNGYVVYKGISSPQVVTGLTNGLTYYYKFYTRLGTNWSTADVEVSATPANVSAATDYFRTAGSGSWASLGIWQSSTDSTTWIPSSLIPGTAAAHVVIQSPDSVWLTANASTKNLTILSGAVMNATTFTMTASARFNLLGTASFYQGGTGTSVPGSGGEQVLASTSNYHFNGAQNGASGAFPEFGNIYWEPAPTGSGTIQNTVATAPFNNGLVIRGNLTVNLQSATAQEVRFATGAATSRSHVIDGDLNIISANSIVVVTNGTGTVLSILNIGGNINMTAGVLRGVNASGQGIVNLKGNLNNTGGTVQTGAGSGTYSINYTGSGNQNINAGGVYTFAANQVDSINNTGAGVTINTAIIHAGTIRFIDGVVTAGNGILTMDAGSAVSNASNASFVNGPVSKIGNTDFVFPVGTLNGGPSGTVPGYVPVTISNSVGGAATDKFTAAYIRGNSNSLGSITAIGLDHISSCDYWTVNQDAGTSTVDVKLSWQDAVNNCSASAYIDNLPTLVVAHFDGTNWNSVGAGGTATGTATAGDVSWPGVSVFSPFTIGSTDFNNPLPITLNYFTGIKQNNSHVLNWKVTCSNTPHTTMVVQRSSGQVFSDINSITADAARCNQPFSYTDAAPLPGMNFYRLKVTDADGKITYSTTVALLNAVKGFSIISIAPNPVVNQNLTLNITSAKAVKMTVNIFDMQGRMVSRQTVSLIAGYSSLPVNVGNLAPGTYTIGALVDGEQTDKIRFVKQ